MYLIQNYLINVYIWMKISYIYISWYTQHCIQIKLHKAVVRKQIFPIDTFES